MSNVVITVADINQPAPGKKQGKVIDTTGKTWQVWADKLYLYAPGQSYNITYKTTNFNGKDYYTIDQSAPAGSAAIAPPPRGTTPTQRAAAVVPPIPTVSDYQEAERIKRRDIFVQGILNNSAQNQDFVSMQTEELIGFTEKLMIVWFNTLGKKPQTASDMNDEIPF